jgi:hypothetical protein
MIWMPGLLFSLPFHPAQNVIYEINILLKLHKSRDESIENQFFCEKTDNGCLCILTEELRSGTLSVRSRVTGRTRRWWPQGEK